MEEVLGRIRVQILSDVKTVTNPRKVPCTLMAQSDPGHDSNGAGSLKAETKHEGVQKVAL